MKKSFLFFFLLTNAIVYSQVSNFSEKFDLPPEVEETSGLLFLNGKIITHNDSGDSAKLYEIDSLSGALTRTISITNATHIDWEDITQDDTHIYIGDIGNNDGNRTDLTIYKILKTGYLTNNSVSADIITFSYEDQTDFSSQSNNSNFDAEAISIYQDQIFIFTKNWVDLMTNVYIIPTTNGTHSAIKVSSYNVDGLITGSNYSSFDDSFMLTGYDSTLTPFLIYIDQNRPSGNNIFDGGAQKISLIQELGQGNQVEGITHYSDGNYYISREKFIATVSGNQVVITQKLFQFFNVGSQTLSADEGILNIVLTVYPNPTKKNIKFNYKNTSLNFSSIEIYNSSGRLIKREYIPNKVSIEELSKGIYFIKVILDNQKSIIKKIIKI